MESAGRARRVQALPIEPVVVDLILGIAFPANRVCRVNIESIVGEYQQESVLHAIPVQQVNIGRNVEDWMRVGVKFVIAPLKGIFAKTAAD